MDVSHLSLTEIARVASLLSDSRAAHEAAKQFRKVRDRDGSSTALQTALRLREEAHALDPEHHAPAWAAEQEHTPRGKDTHAELLAFYRQQLNPEAEA